MLIKFQPFQQNVKYIKFRLCFFWIKQEKKMLVSQVLSLCKPMRNT